MCRIILAVMFAVCVACGSGSGSGSGSSASVNGTIGGQSMTAREAISNVVQFGAGNSASEILITNVTNICAMVSANQEPRNAQAILMLVGNWNGGVASAATATGVYPVQTFADIQSASGPVALVTYGANDASCNSLPGYDGVSGSVTLTRIDSSGYSGTFDVTFESTGGHVTGSFSTTACAGLEASIDGTCT
jgi:hypothetical protein